MSHTAGIPVPVRRVQLSHLSELPNDYGTTPGGTLFSTTPGGTRIIYDRTFLLKCRTSPLSNTPPINLPDIPGVTTPEKIKVNKKIVEEGIAGKENGGVCNISRPLESPLNQMDFDSKLFANRTSPSPLLQYRHRNQIRQNAMFYQKACRAMSTVQAATTMYQSTPAHCACHPPYTPVGAARQMLNDHGFSFEDDSYAGFCTPHVPAKRRPSPTSQLYLWRQNKLKQAVLNGSLQSSILPELSASFRYPQFPPELAIYRGRRNSSATGLLPLNLCGSLEKLFRAHNESSMLDKTTTTPNSFDKHDGSSYEAVS